MPIKSILLLLKAKFENYLIDEARKNYTNDIIYILADNVRFYTAKENLKVKAWSTLYNEFKNKNIINDTRTSKEIEEDTLKLFKQLKADKSKE